jgi:NADPH2:quinone reductase
MLAIRIHEFGGPEVLKAEDSPIPEPGPGQVRVRVAVAGINFIEVYQRRGWYPVARPFVPGAEFAGTVDKVGASVEGFRVGDRVFTASGQGAYAEYALAPASLLAPLPDALPFDQAVALALQGLTAHYLATSTVALSSSLKILVHAAAGGVGQLLTQIARQRGAEVFGTVSTEEKAAVARQAGAQHIILYTQTDFAAEVERIAGSRALDAVYDSVGKDTFEKGLNLLRPRGTMVLYGQSSGPVSPVDPQTLSRGGSLFLTRPTLGDYLQGPGEFRQRVDDLFAWWTEGSLKVIVARKFPLAEAGAAQAYLESRGALGKILLVVGSPS